MLSVGKNEIEHIWENYNVVWANGYKFVQQNDCTRQK